MNSRDYIEWLRGLDKRWQRSRGGERRQILVDSRTAMNYATVAPIVERLQKDPRIKVFFTASESPQRLKEIYAEARPPHQLVKPKTAALMHFDAYLTADFLWARLLRGTRRVQTFHGVAGKYRKVYDSPADSMRGWHRLFFINKRRLQNFVDTGAVDADSPAIRLIGMPRLDCLVDGSLDRSAILNSIGIDPSRKTVLYAPTWSRYSSVARMGEDIVKRLGAAGYVVIVKLHDRSRQADDYHSGGVDWGARLEPLLKSTGGVLATGSNSSSYLMAADILITDHSSVGFEYLLLDRPLIRIHVPELLEKTEIEPVYVELMSEAATSVNNIDELSDAVDDNFANPSAKSASRQFVAGEMFYKPGTATSRAVAEMYDVIELDSAREAGDSIKPGAQAPGSSS
jgi:CDP-glycerol glycerophosphotransferase (TagB/SpsB family)